MQMKIAVIDIGGTCIKSGIWEKGEIREIRVTDTNARLGGSAVMEKVLSLLEGYGEFQAVGISTAGQVDTAEGTVLYANENIPGYTGMKVKEITEAKFGVPVAVLNDVNSAALGEAWYGAGRGYPDFLCLTYGTGVGGAIVTGGEIYTGAGYCAGEFGGIVTHPEARNPEKDLFSGCYERYASTTALLQKARERFPRMQNGLEIFAEIENHEVRELVDQWIEEILYGLISLIHIFNPSLLVLGGGIMEQAYVTEQIRFRLQSHLLPSFRKVEVLPAGLGNRAGMLGAARQAQKEYERRIK